MAEKDARNVATVTLSDTKRDIKTLFKVMSDTGAACGMMGP